jgi:gluconolactonase
MALDEDEKYLYVVRTTSPDVGRFEIDGNELGPQEEWSPALGERRLNEYGESAMELIADPEVGRRWGMADSCAFDAEGNR